MSQTGRDVAFSPRRNVNSTALMVVDPQNCGLTNCFLWSDHDSDELELLNLIELVDFRFFRNP